jgi:hypothetical protein
MAVTIPVQPISIGFDFSQSLTFVDGSGNTLFDFTQVVRIFGQVRAAPINTGTLLATLDSLAVPPTINILSPNSINFIIPRSITSLLVGMTAVYLDFSYYNNSLWTWIPLSITWPIVDPVTVPQS